MASFKKAVRKKAKLRLGIEGPSGSGKSYTSLLIGKGLANGGKIAVIDTENSSASLYSHICDFDVADLDPPYTPERYVQLINEAAQEYDVLIIDSITHEWRGKGGVLEIHDSMPGNSFTNWGKVNPRHDAFMQAMLQAPCHIIATMRSKETYVLQENKNGKQEPKKAGMEALQRDGVIYEFTTVLTMDITNQATRNKDRTELFPVNQWFVPTEETGVKLREWLESGETPPAPPAPPEPLKADRNQVQRIQILCKELGITDREERMERVNKFLKFAFKRTVESTSELTPDEAQALIKKLEDMKQQHAPQEATV